MKLLTPARRPSHWLMYLAAVVALSCQSGQERPVGDGQLRDLGWPSYFPRYRVSLPAVLPQSGTATHFSLRNLPLATYELRVIPVTQRGGARSEAEWEGLAQALGQCGLSVSVTVSGAVGGPHTHTGLLPGDWLRRVSSDWYFSSESLEHLRIEGAAEIELRFVGDADRLSPGFGFQLVLAGGGVTV